MKNKRYKRQAKRMWGRCIQPVESHSCLDCDYLECCCYMPIRTPKYMTLRELEQACKAYKWC